MGNFVTKDSKFIYSDGTGERLLLDLNDFLSNYGRIPFHSDLTEITVPNLVLLNMDNHVSFCNGDKRQENLLAYYTMLDVMFIREHTRSKYPKHVLEIGDDLALYNHISQLAGVLHPETVIQMAENSDLSVGAEKNEDIIFVSVLEKELSAEEVKSINNLLKPGGIVFLLSCVGNSTVSQFKNMFDEVDELTIDNNTIILRGHSRS